jgi:ADP-ribose pyrophosphatase
VDPAQIQPLGGPLFASPGITDEMVYYRAVEADLSERSTPEGDGSVMEEAGEVVLLDLIDALTLCRNGENPDAKTEVGLLRLCDTLGYLPHLQCFADEVQRKA